MLQNKKVGFIGTLGFKKNEKFKKREIYHIRFPLSLNKDLEEMKKGRLISIMLLLRHQVTV